MPEDFKVFRLADLNLYAHTSLPVISILDSALHQIGWLLGHAINSNASLVKQPFHLEAPVGHPLDQTNLSDEIDKFIGRHGGRFALIFSTPEFARLYLDAGGTLAAVYDHNLQIVASTLTLLLINDRKHHYFNKSVSEFPSNRPDQFFPSGLTAVKAVTRLLPNHYLDLKAWKCTRHWPRATSLAESQGDVSKPLEALSATLQINIRGAVSSSDHTYAPLTAGRDSRVIASIIHALGLIDRVTFVTFDYPEKSRSNLLDLHIAHLIARRFGLTHKVVPVPDSINDQERRDYLLRIGFSGGHGKVRDFFIACKEHLDLESAWITGFGGEVGRAYYWRKETMHHPNLTADDLINRLGLPKYSDFVSKTDAWISDLPVTDKHSMLDLAYLEFRLGCWGSPHLYGAAPFVINILPFSHRLIFSSMLKLPTSYRQNESMSTDIIASHLGDLLCFPFNDWPLGWKKVKERMTWKMRSIARVVGMM